MDSSLYADHRCRLCGKKCQHGIARENHARKHEREGTVIIKGFGGPSGRRYEITRTAMRSIDSGGGVKVKPFEAWLVMDSEGTYVPSLHMTRRDAKEHAAGSNYLRDAKWRVVRVIVRRAPNSAASK